jgi:hypothetical protein
LPYFPLGLWIELPTRSLADAAKDTSHRCYENHGRCASPASVDSQPLSGCFDGRWPFLVRGRLPIGSHASCDSHW